MNENSGWQTLQPDDWVYYPQQMVNVSLNPAKVSLNTGKNLKL
jgi:hypothetical protein